MHEVSAYVARYAFGLPVDWLRQASDQGSAGLPIDPESPPLFETQAAYLDRHGLLTAAERRALKRKPSPSGEAVPP
ncbi:hypothetical protein [Aureimonas ureilytica]|nr:hypothetical protein [Aureimonas ureilytica]